MNEAFKTVLKDYLKRAETDYALLLNGAWGSGKTYFIKNTISNEVENVVCPSTITDKGKEKKYTPIYVSLYGASSIEDIKDRMFYAIRPEFKWVGIIANKVCSVSEFIPEYGSTIKNIFTFKDKEKQSLRKIVSDCTNKVFFFDDLERIDINKIDIQSVLGYINSLAEHNHYKIVVIANEKEVSADYKQFKEKTIRFSFEFCPSISEIFDSVCDKYNGNREYKKFLKEQKTDILDILHSGDCNNIRTLIFITDVFQQIFEKISGDYSNEINQCLLFPFAIIAIESKDGKTKEELIKALNSYDSWFLQGGVSQNANQTEKYDNILYNKYRRFRNSHYIIFYNELYDLVYDGYVPEDDLERMITMVRNECQNCIETEEIKLVYRIIEWEKIPDDEFNDVVNSINTNIKSNKYSLKELFEIYAAYVRIEALEIEGFQITEEVTDIFKSAINVAMRKQPYYPSYFETQVPIWGINEKSKAQEKYAKLRKYAFEINQRLKEESFSNEKRKILNWLSNSDSERLSTFIYDRSNKKLLMQIPPQDIINAITSANTETKRIFSLCLTVFFPDDSNDLSQNDIDFLKGFKSALDDYLNKQTTRKPSLAYLYEIQLYIGNIIVRNANG